MQLKLGEKVLRIDVNVDALDLPSSPDPHIYNCLQEHIMKLQVNCLYSFYNNILKQFKVDNFILFLSYFLVFFSVSFFFILGYFQAVSGNLKRLKDAASSTKSSVSLDAVTSSSLTKQTSDSSAPLPLGSDAAESKTAPDDVMVQIKARKSEVGPSQQICQLFRQWHFWSPLYSLSTKWIIISNCSWGCAHDVPWWSKCLMEIW